MNHQPELADEFFIRLSERLHAIQPNSSVPVDDSPPITPIRYRDMIEDMMIKALSEGRNFLDDVFRLISVYYRHGTNNTGRIFNEWEGSAELKEQLASMVDVYGIKEVARIDQLVPTLSRIAEALPHIALVLASEIHQNPYLGLKLWVSDRDLGTRVDYLFKLNCFPSLVDVDSSTKAQACLLLFNLCHAKATINRQTTNKNVATAFANSCKFSANIVEQKLAPQKLRDEFTLYLESIPLSPELMNKVWTQVVGDVKISLHKSVTITAFHREVIDSQPLYLLKWYDLLHARKSRA